MVSITQYTGTGNHNIFNKCKYCAQHVEYQAMIWNLFLDGNRYLKVKKKKSFNVMYVL
jgi:hypothetical protein